MYHAEESQNPCSTPDLPSLLLFHSNEMHNRKILHFLHKIMALLQELCYFNLVLLLQTSPELMMLPSLISSASSTNILISLCVKAIHENIL